jgi:1-acyl-sn-glycerol-3-phosphate acyltransferase
MAADMDATWQVPRLWRALQVFARVLIFPFCRLQVTVEDPAALRTGPLILAANHISPVDPAIMTAACGVAGIAPRFLATGGLFDAPGFGWVMRKSGHLRVDRGTAQVADALPLAAAALKENSVVLVYPEGRIGRDPWMWPERGKTGVARMAALSGSPVLPVGQWGAHRVMPWGAPKGWAKSVWWDLRHRPVVQIRFGRPVDLSGLTGTAGAQAMRATQRIMTAIDETLAPLRSDEMEMPRHPDTTRPLDLSRVRPR